MTEKIEEKTNSEIKQFSSKTEMTYAIKKPSEEEVKKRQEQARTTLAKTRFIEWFKKTKGVIYIACEKADIDEGTYYNWIKSDPAFAERVKQTEEDKNNIAADILWSKVQIKKETQAIKYYLDRRHPGYKPRMVEEVVDGNVTLEDLFDRSEEELNAKDNKQDHNEPNNETGSSANLDDNNATTGAPGGNN